MKVQYNQGSRGEPLIEMPISITVPPRLCGPIGCPTKPGEYGEIQVVAKQTVTGTPPVSTVAGGK